MNEPQPPLAYQSRLMTYEEAGKEVGRSAEWIARQIKEGKLVGTDLGRRTKRISELNWQKFLARCQTLEKSINPSR